MLLSLLYRWLAAILERRGHSSLAQTCYREAARLAPGDARAPFVLGSLLLRQGRAEEAAQAFRQALAADPDHAEAHNNLGVALAQQEQLDAAAACYCAALRLKPDHAAAHNNLGNVHLVRGQLDEAEASYRAALRCDRHYVEAHNNLGLVLLEQGRHQDAEKAIREALRLRPDFAGALNNLGSVLLRQGEVEEAVACLQQALRLQPDLGEAHINLALILGDMNQLAGAVDYYRNKLRFNPDSAEAHFRLGMGLQAQGKLVEARQHFEAMLKIRPEAPEALANLGGVALREGNLDEALAFFKAALEHAPVFAGAHYNYFFCLNYSADYEPAEVFAQHARWAEAHADPLSSAAAPFANSRRRDRKLRVGYVSPDFRAHSVAYFIEPVIRHHDRDRFEVYCYSNALQSDEVTARIRALADVWRDIRLQTTSQVCEQVRADGIDILVDLAGHTGRNRLAVFAHKPAPIQVTYIGYPNTTGLAAMDYRITDAYADPPGLTERFHTEQLVRLPQTFLVYAPPADSPEVAPPPLARKGHVTFGSFNNAAKVIPRVIALWSKILHAVPDSRLMLKHFAFHSAEAKERFQGLFAQNGIAADRIDLLDFVPTVSSHLELYHEVDIALDPFPYNGTTTTCEALWMGVPVITLAGKVHAGRVGVSLLSNAGLAELIADSEEAYVRIAVELANDVQRLAGLRAAMRARLENCPLTDARALARALEAEYAKMWQRWCETPAAAGDGAVPLAAGAAAQLP
ncbi:MAG: tetratricopeptide repeat protein [Burkholderiales bacterium]